MQYLYALFFFAGVAAFAGEPIKVAILDTGLDLKDARFEGHICRTGHKDFTETGLLDDNGHGTHVAGLIQKHAGNKDYCLLILKYFSERASGLQNLAREIQALRYAAELGVDVVNLSGGGPEFFEEEYLIIRGASNTKFVVAAGNDSEDIDTPGQEYYPASYSLPNIVAVGNLLYDGVPEEHSNWGKRVAYWELGAAILSTLPNGKQGYMTGTSQATAVATGKLIAGTLKKKVSPFKVFPSRPQNSR